MGIGVQLRFIVSAAHAAQVGLPSSAEQYVHRVGRTARAGKGGEGVLLLSPFEAHFLATLKGGKHRAHRPACVQHGS